LIGGVGEKKKKKKKKKTSWFQVSYRREVINFKFNLPYPCMLHIKAVFFHSLFKSAAFICWVLPVIFTPEWFSEFKCFICWWKEFLCILPLLQPSFPSLPLIYISCLSQVGAVLFLALHVLLFLIIWFRNWVDFESTPPLDKVQLSLPSWLLHDRPSLSKSNPSWHRQKKLPSVLMHVWSHGFSRHSLISVKEENSRWSYNEVKITLLTYLLTYLLTHSLNGVGYYSKNW